MSVQKKMQEWKRGCVEGVQRAQARLSAKLACERGQGTTEYAILVGVQMSG